MLKKQLISSYNHKWQYELYWYVFLRKQEKQHNYILGGVIMLEKDDLEVLVAVYSLCDGTMIKCTGLYNVCEATSFCADEVANRLMELRANGFLSFPKPLGGNGMQHPIADIRNICLTVQGIDYIKNPFETRRDSHYSQISNQFIGNFNSPGGTVNATNISQQNIVNLSPEEISEIKEKINSINSKIKESDKISEDLKRELSQILDTSKERLMAKDNNGFMSKLKEFWLKFISAVKSIDLKTLLQVISKLITVFRVN